MKNIPKHRYALGTKVTLVDQAEIYPDVRYGLIAARRRLGDLSPEMDPDDPERNQPMYRVMWMCDDSVMVTDEFEDELIVLPEQDPTTTQDFVFDCQQLIVDGLLIVEFHDM